MEPREFLFEHMVFYTKEHGRIMVQAIRKGDNHLVLRAPPALGSFTLHEIRDEYFSVWNCEVLVPEDITLTASLDDDYLGLLFATHNNLEFSLEAIVQSEVLEENHFAFLHVSFIRNQCMFHKDKHHRFSGIYFTQAYLERFEKAFPWLAKTMERVRAKSPAYSGQVTLPPAFGISALMTDLLQEHHGEQGKLYRDIKVNELLWRALYEHEHNQASSKMKLDPDEQLALEAVRNAIADDPAKPILLNDLAKEFGINKFKLKNGFRQLFGLPVKKYQDKERMLAAIRWLDDPELSISDIAGKVGYKNASSFTTAFKKAFDITPMDYRQRPRLNGNL
jgi:AraC-like DNA-binding protein